MKKFCIPLSLLIILLFSGSSLAPNTSQHLADGFNFARSNGVHIINCSWGHDDLQSSFLDDAIDNALTLGRDGRGMIIVFASGNNNSATSNYPANSNPLILNVGAIDRCGIRSGRTDIITEATPCDPWCATCDPGSAFGNTLDIVARGSTVSTADREGNAGYNPGQTLMSLYFLKVEGGYIDIIPPEIGNASAHCRIRDFRLF
ncbi:S8 family serine peptidase [Parapedobacter soli]|uniref:S8 family serine peptidase n=1 Tax=Parapedobacter soli TaxID=416955 RepID=UPI0021C97A37|nr:S8 family serine peptidase [Parapedobacter soli]